MNRMCPMMGIAAAAGLAFAGSANATFFSFASDMNSNAYTFGGSAGTTEGAFTLSDFSRPNTFSLLVDDNNGLLPTVSIPVEFRASLTATLSQSTAIAGTLFLHTYFVSGTFGFYDAMGNAILSVNVDSSLPALLTVPGGAASWASTGAVLGSDSFSSITYTASNGLVNALGGSATALQYGVSAGVFAAPSDFAFDLSVINGGAIGLAVALDPISKSPLNAFRSESSYSGSVGSVIPTPATAALIIAGAPLLVLSRRRK